MAEPQIVSGRLLVTLDEDKNNIGRIIESNCKSESRLMTPSESIYDPLDETPTQPIEYYDHIVFVKEMSDEVEIDDVSYVGMSVDAILAVIPDD